MNPQTTTSEKAEDPSLALASETKDQIDAWKAKRFDELNGEACHRKRLLKRQLLRQLKKLKAEKEYQEEIYNGDPILCRHIREEVRKLSAELAKFCDEVNQEAISERVNKDCKKWLESQKSASGSEYSDHPESSETSPYLLDKVQFKVLPYMFLVVLTAWLIMKII